MSVFFPNDALKIQLLISKPTANIGFTVVGKALLVAVNQF